MAIDEVWVDLRSSPLTPLIPFATMNRHEIEIADHSNLLFLVAFFDLIIVELELDLFLRLAFHGVDFGWV